MSENNEEVGSLEHIHQKIQEVFPLPFIGGRFILNKGLSQNFQVNHSLTFGSGDQSGYKFGATYVGHNKISEAEPYPLLMGEIQPNGNLQAQVVTNLNKKVKLKYLAQIQNNIMVGQKYVIEMKNDQWQTGLTLTNPDIQKNECISMIDIMKKVNGGLYLGSMFVCNFTSMVPGGKEANWSLGGKYFYNDWQTALSFRPLQSAFHASFWMKVKSDLHFSGELESSFPQQTNVASIGYQYDLPKSGLVWKSQIDSNANVISSFEKRLFPFPFTFSICAVAALLKGKYDFGVGLTLG